VWMYVSLLVSVVVIPRLLLAVACAWREERLARNVPVELDAEYAARVESLMNAASIRLGLLAHRAEDRDRFVLLLPGKHALPVVVNSAAGDVLRLVDIDANAPLPAASLP